MNNCLAKLSQKKFFYPLIYALFLIISFLPPITQNPYSPENTQQVIIELLMVAIKPYENFGIIFHAATIIIAGLILIESTMSKRLLFGFMGVDFIIIALVQSFGKTELYGDVIHTGGLAAFVLLGILWIYAAITSDRDPFRVDLQWHHLILLPFAILSFWSPYKVEADVVLPNFNPALLLTSPDYGLTFCFTTPVFLYLLFVLYPKVNIPVYRITAFNGLLYALFNIVHWFNPDTRRMGALHIPLLVLSTTSLIQTRKRNKLIEDNGKVL